MGNRDRLRSSLKEDGKQTRRSLWHSKAYHRFFEGYTEIAVPNSNGKGTSIQRVYTGDTYRQDLPKGQRILLRVVYVALFLCIVYLFGSSAILPLASNSTWYVVLTQAVSLPLLFWVVIAFYAYLPAGQDMTIDEYRRSSLALKKATFGSAVGLGAAALATLVFMLLHLSDQPLAELLCAVKYIASGLFALSMNWVEKKVKYLVIPSQNEPFVDG